MPLLADLVDTRANTDEIRRYRKALQRAQTEIKLYRNTPGQVGLTYRGHVNVLDAPKHKFPQRDNISSAGLFTIPTRHPMARWIASIPNTPEECKNVVVRADRYGGLHRWSGLMHHWDVETIDGVDYLTAHFNDDLQFVQFLLVPPNPATPIWSWQFPRDYLVFAPTRWGVSTTIEAQIRRNVIHDAAARGVHLDFVMPDDPFDHDQYETPLDASTWQMHVKCPKFGQDSSLWAPLGARMNSVDSVIADALEDGQLSLTYRRIFTDEGETITGLRNNNIANGALVFEVLDRSGFAHGDGTYFSGSAAGGLARSILTWTTDFLDDTLAIVDDDQSLTPDEYWQNGWMGTLAKKPGVAVRDSIYNDLKSRVTHAPATVSTIVVGGDNPTMDALAQLTIQATGNILGYFLLFGFDSAGDIAAEVIMPFLVGTIMAWNISYNLKRADNLGWCRLLEAYVSGAEQNNWSFSALAVTRGGYKHTDAETAHTMVLDDSTWVIPGLHYQIGDRISSSAGALQRMGIDLMFVNQVKEMSMEGDDTGKSEFLTKVGQAKSAMSRGERDSRMLKKLMDRVSDIGVHLIQ